MNNNTPNKNESSIETKNLVPENFYGDTFAGLGQTLNKELFYYSAERLSILIWEWMQSNAPENIKNAFSDLSFAYHFAKSFSGSNVSNADWTNILSLYIRMNNARLDLGEKLTA